jgi:hypothetical protein
MKESRLKDKIKQYLLRLFLAALIFVLLPVFPRQKQQDEFIDKKEWSRLTDGEDYTEHSKPFNPGCSGPEVPDGDGISPQNNLIIFQFFAYGGLVIILAVLIWYLISSRLISSDIFKRRQDNSKVSFEYAEKNLEAIDDREKLHDLLKKAIEYKNYGLAVRIRFVLLIRLMDERQLLKFRINKTNRHYIQDVGMHEVRNDFVRIVRLFERIWYGSREISEVEFASINQLFDRFSSKIPANEK